MTPKEIEESIKLTYFWMVKSNIFVQYLSTHIPNIIFNKNVVNF